VARLCAATGSPLHLVGKLGFRIDAHSVRRAGVDYWHLVDVRTHACFDDFLTAFRLESAEDVESGGRPGVESGAARLHLFSATATASYLDAAVRPGDAFVFGKESVGLSPELLARFSDRVVGIPTLGAVRSHNLANAVGIALYEALRNVGALAEPFMG